MQCPQCSSTHIRKNGIKQGKQNHICVACGRQFIDTYDTPRTYSDDIKQHCLTLYVNGMGFRAIERVTGVHHPTVIYWVKQVGHQLPDAPSSDKVPQVGQRDELETFVGSKKNKIWLWTAVDHFRPGILAWVLGDHSGETFQPLRAIVGAGKCYFYVTDGWSVYPGLIADGDQIVSKTYMTRVEGENTRLRHYLARLHRKTLCYSNSEEMLRHSIRLLLHYLRFWDVPVPQ
nr:IS1 family transposase [Chroococcidiopsis sp. CCMEE 29]